MPKCCWIPIRIASTIGAIATVITVIVFAILTVIFLVNVTDGSRGFTYLIVSVIVIAIVQIGCAIAFTVGIYRFRHRWMIPLIFCTACVCVATIGADLAITITTGEDLKEKSNPHLHPHFSFVEAIVFRVLLSLLVVLQVAVLVCFVRCFMIVRKVNLLQNYADSASAYFAKTTGAVDVIENGDHGKQQQINVSYT